MLYKLCETFESIMTIIFNTEKVAVIVVRTDSLNPSSLCSSIPVNLFVTSADQCIRLVPIFMYLSACWRIKFRAKRQVLIDLSSGL